MAEESLQEGLNNVKIHAQQMRKALNTRGKLMEALKDCSQMLGELRTNNLNPKQYYELYTAIFDQLNNLSETLREFHPNPHLAELYELVQYCGNIVPRLYLMITVGGAYMTCIFNANKSQLDINSKLANMHVNANNNANNNPNANNNANDNANPSQDERPVQARPSSSENDKYDEETMCEVMKDMLEMCRGVQHPIRGLFLRYYLSQCTRNCLPLNSLNDSIEFIITNFIEMNKLWVRLQHQGHSRERLQRIKERKELQILVGSNLVRLSQLDGITINQYSENILPAILIQIVQCRDILAQEYLFEVITQAFPDDFHLYTLDQLLNSINNLLPQVNVKQILISLIDRLAAYAQSNDQFNDNSFKNPSLTYFKQDLSTNDKANLSETNTNTNITQEIHNYTNVDTEDNNHKDTDNSIDKFAIENSNLDQGRDQDASQGIPSNIPLFDIFNTQIKSIIAAHPEFTIADISSLLLSLASLTINCYPSGLDNLEDVFKSAYEMFIKYQETPELSTEPALSNYLSLLTLPIKSYPSILTSLSIPHYIPLLEIQPYANSRAIGNLVIQSILEKHTYIKNPQEAKLFFKLLTSLIKNGRKPQSYPSANSGNLTLDNINNNNNNNNSNNNNTNLNAATVFSETEETLEEQGMLARVIHFLKNDDIDTNLQLLYIARSALAEGGDRVIFTSPSIVTEALNIVRRYYYHTFVDESDKETKINSTFKFIHNIIFDLYGRNNSGAAELALRLFVNAGQIADQVKVEEVAYELYAQAFTIYEEAISDSRAQFQAITIIIACLQQSRNFTRENYDTLITKCALHSSKLLKKPDQCRAVYLASHLWWATEIPALNEDNESNLYRDGKRVLECLQRALRVADACMDASVSIQLFVEILNQYIYYFEQRNPAIAVKFLTGIIELIKTNLENAGVGKAVTSNEISENSVVDAPRKYFLRTLDYIESQKEVDERFKEITW